jgi:hypothetical protein
MRRKKSLSFVLFGLALFLFTISFQKSQFGNANSNSKDATGSEQSLEISHGVSLQIPSELLGESKLKDGSHDVNNRGKSSNEEILQVISLQNSEKAPIYRARNHILDKTTVSRGESSLLMLI